MGVATEHRRSTYRQVSADRSLGLLAAGVVLLGCIVGNAFLVGYVATYSSRFPPQFTGWQVDAVEGACAAVLVSLTVVAILAFRRRWRATRAGSRRLAILLAVLPGLVIGGCLSAGVNAAVAWAGNQTTEAAAARAWQAAYVISPPPMPVSGPPADPALTARVLTASDFGTGWYQDTQPGTEGIAVTPEERDQGRTSQARTLLGQQHWTGTVWALDRSVIEQVMQFDTAAHAAAYMATWRQQNAGSTIATFTFGKVTVATARTRTGDLAAFTVGDYAIIVDVSGTLTSQPESLDGIITAAVTAASPAS